MAKSQKIKNFFNVSFNSRDENTGDDIIDVTIRWENPTEEENIKNLNKWLVMIDSNLVVTSKTSN